MKGKEQAFVTERLDDVANVLSRYGEAICVRIFGDPVELGVRRRGRLHACIRQGRRSAGHQHGRRPVPSLPGHGRPHDHAGEARHARGQEGRHQLGLLAEPQEAGQRAAFDDGRELALRRPCRASRTPRASSSTRSRSPMPRTTSPATAAPSPRPTT